MSSIKNSEIDIKENIENEFPDSQPFDNIIEKEIFNYNDKKNDEKTIDEDSDSDENMKKVKEKFIKKKITSIPKLTTTTTKTKKKSNPTSTPVSNSLVKFIKEINNKVPDKNGCYWKQPSSPTFYKKISELPFIPRNKFDNEEDFREANTFYFHSWKMISSPFRKSLFGPSYLLFDEKNIRYWASVTISEYISVITSEGKEKELGICVFKSGPEPQDIKCTPYVKKIREENQKKKINN